MSRFIEYIVGWVFFWDIGRARQCTRKVKRRGKNCKKKNRVGQPVGIAGSRTEGDGVVGAGAGEGRRGVVVGVAVRPRARPLEHLRVHRRVTRVRIAVVAAAAVLRRAERLARAPASLAMAGLQLGGAPLVEVHDAPGRRAPRRRRLHHHGQVVPVHLAHVVVVLPAAAAAAQRELHQRRRRRRPRAAALHLAGAAVPRRASALAVVVERAPRPRPEPPRPPRRRRQRPRLAGAQREPRRPQRRAPATPCRLTCSWTWSSRRPPLPTLHTHQIHHDQLTNRTNPRTKNSIHHCQSQYLERMIGWRRTHSWSK